MIIITGRCICNYQWGEFGQTDSFSQQESRFVSSNYANKQAICNYTGQVSVSQGSSLLRTPVRMEKFKITSCWLFSTSAWKNNWISRVMLEKGATVLGSRLFRGVYALEISWQILLHFNGDCRNAKRGIIMENYLILVVYKFRDRCTCNLGL